MKKVNQFFAEHGIKCIIVLLFLTYLKTCSVSSDLGKVKKHINDIDSIPTRVEVKNLIQIEGLKAEKRMIQSTDRKMLDVTRQSQIDIEISNLEKNNQK
jgi:hypothetical protein